MLLFQTLAEHESLSSPFDLRMKRFLEQEVVRWVVVILRRNTYFCDVLGYGTVFH